MGLSDSKKIFVQLLPRPKSGEDDIYGYWRLSCELLGHVIDSNRLAHLEHQNLAAAAACRCLKSELNRFRNRHEIAGHVGVRHRNRTPVCYLLPACRQNRATTRKNVSKSNTDVFTLFERGSQPLGQPLRVSKHAHRINRLVSGNVDKSTHSAPVGCLKNVDRSPDIRLESLGRPHFKKWQMLERCGVKDDIGLVFIEYPIESLCITNIADDQVPRIEQSAPLNGQLNLVQGRLISFQHDEQ